MNIQYNYFLYALCMLTSALAYPVTAYSDATMEAAQTAYDEGRFEDALTAYASLKEESSHPSGALLFNLGNVYYRLGRIPEAIWHYRAASYLLPRDRDVRHNLAYVINEHDVLYAQPRIPWAWFGRVSLPEWIALATVMWWFIALYAVLALKKRDGKRWIKPLYLSAILGLLSLAGIGYWTSLQFKPEFVIMEPNQEALFAPIDASTAHFTLPAGSVVRIESKTDLWYFVRAGSQSGWVRKSAGQKITGLF